MLVHMSVQPTINNTWYKSQQSETTKEEQLIFNCFICLDVLL